MMVQVENTEKGYIVSAYLYDVSGYGRWHRLRNFGTRQGDARFFMLYIVPNYSNEELKLALQTYNECKICRIDKGKTLRYE